MWLRFLKYCQTQLDILWPVYRVLSDWGLGLMVTFLPFYLFTLGFSVREILVYGIIFFICRLLFAPLASSLIPHWGSKRILVLGHLLSIAFLLSLISLNYASQLLFLMVAFLSGAAFSFLRLSWGTYRGQLRPTPSSLGWHLLIKSGQIAGPICGALIIVTWGGRPAAALGSLILAGALVILMKLPSSPPKGQQPSYERIWRLLKRQGFKCWLLASSYLLKNIPFQLWLLYLAIFVLEAQTSAYWWLGWLTSLSLALSLVVSWLWRTHWARFRPWGLGLEALLSLWRWFIGGVGSMVGHNLLKSQAETTYQPKKARTLEAILTREIIFMSANCLAFIVVLGLTYIIPDTGGNQHLNSLKVGFVVIGLVTSVSLLVHYLRNNSGRPTTKQTDSSQNQNNQRPASQVR